MNDLGPVLELGKAVKAKGLYQRFDEDTGSFVIDERLAEQEISSFLRGKRDAVVEWIDLSFVSVRPDTAVVLRTRPDVLKKRLEKRGYPNNKISENVMAELLGVIRHNLMEKWPEAVVDIDTTETTPETAANTVREVASGKIKKTKAIDWLSEMNPEDLDELIGEIDMFGVRKRRCLRRAKALAHLRTPLWRPNLGPSLHKLPSFHRNKAESGPSFRPPSA